MTTDKNDHNEAKRRAALADLERLERQSETLTGSLAAMGKRTASHFSGNDEPDADAIEIWGKRVGRALSLAGCMALAIYLYATYLR